VAALSGHRAVVARFEVRVFFRIFTYGFHRIVRVAPTSSGSFVSECLRRVSPDRLGCIRYFGIETKSTSRQQAVRKCSFLPDFLPRDSGGAPGDASDSRVQP
jgi:hypothetical protein